MAGKFWSTWFFCRKILKFGNLSTAFINSDALLLITHRSNGHLPFLSTSSKLQLTISKNYVCPKFFPAEKLVKKNWDTLFFSEGKWYFFLLVVAIFWARVLCHLVVEEARFRIRITLGVILIRSLVYTKHVAGRLRSGSGVALDSWVH